MVSGFRDTMHALLDTFIGMDAKTPRRLLAVNYVSAAFSIIGLFTIYFEIISGTTSLGDLINCEDLKFDFVRLCQDNGE
jgi:hypothetical protein